MDETVVARYWCHMCSQMVDPIMDEMKCPYCEDGFVEEVDSRRDPDSDPSSDRALALWAPILLGMMGGNPSRRRRTQREEEDEQGQGESVQEHDARWIRRRRRNSTAFLQLLQGLSAGITSESDGSESERERERVILINPYNQAIILQGSFDMNQNENPSTLGDYFIGPGLDMLLQHLAENDPNRYGTPPAQKEAVEALPTVKIEQNLSCSVCLEDFDLGAEAKEMPCKHKFHGGCILPWLEIHSSCPVCRFQMPVDGPPKDLNGSGNSNRVENSGDDTGAGAGAGADVGGERSGGEEGGSGNGRRFWAPIPWPFNGFFFSGSQNGGNSSSSASSPSSETPGSSSQSHTAEN